MRLAARLHSFSFCDLKKKQTQDFAASGALFFFEFAFHAKRFHADEDTQRPHHETSG
jgi:hypothetical protein